MKTTRRAHTMGQRLFSLLLAMLLVFGMVPVTGTAATGDGIDTWADPQTLTRPELIYGDNTINAGKVTVGKSVSTTDVTVNGQTVELDDPNNFLVTISQSAQVMGLASETSVPVDVVFVLDTSGSMGYNNTSYKTGRAEAMVNAANNAISTLLAANEHNRVSVVAFSSEGYGGGTSDDDAANLLSPLYHYEGAAATKHLQWVNNNKNAYNYSTTNTTSTNFGVGSNYYLIAGRTTNGNVGNTRDGGNGGTNIHAGFALGAQQLMNVTDTTVTYEDGTTVTRMPFIVLLSDGAPTFSSSTQNWYNPSQTAEQGPGNDDYSGNGFLAALTAAYYKGAITNHYYGTKADNNNRCNVYTIGVSVGNDVLANLTLNPKENFNANATGYNHGGRFASYWRNYNSNNLNNGFTVNVNDDEYFRITNATISATKNFVAGKNANGAAMYTEGTGITYNDGYYSATQTSEIAGIFQTIITEISKKAIASPTHVGSTGADFSGYVNFYDPIGEYMEVKDMKGIVADGFFYQGASAAQNMASGTNTEFNTLLEKVLKTRMTMTGSNVSGADLLQGAKASPYQAYYNSPTDYDNSIVWWGHAYEIQGEEDPGMQVVGSAYNDTLEYITDSETTIPAGATHVCRSYFFYGEAGGANTNPNHEYLYFIVRVQRSLTAPYQQTVVISAPASLLSMETVLITEESDGSFTATVEEAAPARVVYEVGLQDGITAENVAAMVDTKYTGEAVNGIGQVNYDPATDTYYFFTNDWNRGESLGSHHRAMAHATFDAAADNAFYTYQEDTLLVDANGNPVTSNPAGTTAYYVRTYYEWGTTANSDGTYDATQKTTLIEVDIPANANLVQKDGKYYIPKGAYTGSTLVVNGDDAGKITNVTGTSAIVAHPHRTGEANNSHYTVLLGNNGVLALTAVDTKFVSNVTQNITNADGKAVMVDDVLTYKINVRNSESTVADAVVTDTIPVGTELVAGSISHGGTAANGVITWNLKDLAVGSTTTVSFQVKVTQAALDDAVISVDNTATIKLGNDPAYNTNTTKNPPEGKKVLTTDDKAVGDVEVGQTLVYSIEYTNDQASASTVTITDKIPTGTTYVEGTATHGGVYDADTKTITWTLNNVGVGVRGMVSFKVLVNITAVEKVENQATIKIGTNDPKQTNKIINTVLDGDLVLKKTVVIPAGLTPSANVFTLTLTETGSVLGNVTLNGKFAVEGSSLVNEIEFVNGVATVQIKHNETLTIKDLPSGAKINVRENVPAGFTASIPDTGSNVTIDDQTTASVAITNTYAVTPVTVTLEGNKKLTGTTPESETFGFTAVPCNASGVPTGAQGVTGEAILKNGEQAISFGTLNFTAPGNYYYLVREINGGETGMTYDSTEYLVTIVVTDNGDGTLSQVTTLASRTGNTGSFTPVAAGDKAVFTNQYKPLPTDITLEGTKILTGRDLKDGEFSFVVMEGNSVVSTGTNKADKSIEFRPITYSAVGTHTYTITEVQGSLHGVTYSTASYTITVEVTDVNGQLVATVKNASGAVINADSFADTFRFENTFTPDDVTLDLIGEKTLTGATLKAEAFAFVVKDSTGKVVATGNNDANEQIKFSPIVYTRAMLGTDNTETFTYTVSELKPDVGADPNLYYDPAVFTVTVTVTYDPSNGTMTVGTPTYKKGTSDVTGISFANIQNPATVTVTPVGSKTTDSMLNADVAFSFSVTMTNAENTLVASGTSGKNGNITFSSISYDSDDLAAGNVYHYWIKEDLAGTTHAGITYDSNKYLMVVTLSRNATNKLEADVKYYKLRNGGNADTMADYDVNVDPADVKFHNDYTVQGTTVEFNATKVLTGRALKNGEFAFGLYHIDNGVETLVDTANNVDRDNDGIFDDIHFVRSYEESVLNGGTTREIRYVIREVDNKIHGVNYEKALANPIYVKVTVTHTQGQMNTVVAYYSDSAFTNQITDPAFVNEFTPDDTSLTLDANKTLTGAALKAEAFAFVVEDAGNNVVATGNNGFDTDGNGIIEGAELGAVKFTPIVYTFASQKDSSGNILASKEYTYYVRELTPDVGRDPNLYYDPVEFKVTVTVTYDQATGEFKANVTKIEKVENGSVIGTVNTIDFSNIQNPSTITVTPEGNKTITGSNIPANLRFSFRVVSMGTDMANLTRGKVEATGVSSGERFTEDKINFTALVYDSDAVGKTFYYIIEEVIPGANTVDYDTTQYGMAVTIGRNETNALTKTVTYYTFAPGNDPTDAANWKEFTGTDKVHFTNNYSAFATLNIFGTKTLTGRELEKGEFDFRLQLLDKDGKLVDRAIVDGVNEAPAQVGGSGRITFGTLQFTHEQIHTDYLQSSVIDPQTNNTVETYEYKALVSELVPQTNAIPGVTYTTAKYIVVIQWKITTDSSSHSSYGQPEVVGVYAASQTGDVYSYDPAANLLTAGNTVENVLGFTNVYAPVVGDDIRIEGTKQLTGRQLKSGEFSFHLYHIDNGVEKLVDTATNDANGNFYFVRNYAANTPKGNYEYVVKELNNSIHGMTYAQNQYKIVVNIDDDGDGNLVATLQSIVELDQNGDPVANGNTSVVFTNHYTPDDVSVILQGNKTLVDDKDNELTMNVDEFAFVVKDGNSVVATGNNAADGTITFSPIVYTIQALDGVTAVNGVKTKEFTYTVDELEPDTGRDPNLYYDPATFTVTVTVTYDEATGEFKVASVEYPTNGVSFKNIQNPAFVSVTPDGSKTYVDVNGNALAITANQFSFSVLDKDNKTVAAGMVNENGKINFSDILYDSDDLGGQNSAVFSYMIVEDKGNAVYAGIHYDGTKYRMEVTLSRNSTNKLVTDKKYFALKENGDASNPADYTIPVNPADVKFTNIYKVTEPTKVDIFADKVLNGRDLGNGEFSFGLYHLTEDAQGNPEEKLVDTATNGDRTDDGVTAYGDIYFTRTYSANVLGGADSIEIKYVIRELNNGLGGVDYSAAEAKPIYVKVTVTDNHNGTMSTSVVYSYNQNFDAATTQKLSFTNTYKSQDTSYTPEANKVLNGRNQKDDEFSFVVTDDSGAIVSTGLSKAAASGVAGEVVFTPITYTFDDLRGAPIVNGKPTKEFSYTISEVKGNLTNMTYTDVKYYLVVTVTDNNDGTMTATHKYYTNENHTQETQTVVFTNSYIPVGTTISLEADKTLTGRDAVNGEFSFVVKEGEVVVATGGNHDGKVQFSGIGIDVDDMDGNLTKTFTYTMEELATTQGGMTFDTTKYTVEVVVTNNLDTGHLEVTDITYKKGTEKVSSAVFGNEYKVQVDVDLVAGKTLVGKTLTEGEFKFELRDKDNHVLSQTTNKADGSVSFPTFTYTQEDLKDVAAVNGVRTKTFYYSINEVVGSGTAASNGKYTYDESIYDVTVVLTDDGNGNLDATVTYTKRTMTRAVHVVGSAEFINYYTPNAIVNWELPIVAEKVVETPENSGYELDTFHFQVTNTVGEVIATGTNDATGKISFNPTITLSNAGWYYFRITEIPDAEPIPGITYDATVWEIHVHVRFDETNGKLYVNSEDIHIYKLEQMERAAYDKVVFTNTYTPAPTNLTFKVYKSLSGRDLAAGEFSFHLGRETSLGDLIEFEAYNEADGWATFHLTYTKAGTYEYVLHEVVPDAPLGGVTYDRAVYHVTVVVTDDGSGQLKVTSETITDSQGNAVEDVVFNNTYAAKSAEVNLKVNKVLSGRTMKPGEFTFTLTDAQGKVKNAVNDADGKVSFETLTFTEAGVHTYTVAEVKGTAQGMTYDETKYTVTVTVTDNGKGELLTDVVYTKGTETVSEISFTNIYKGLSTTVDVEAQKVLEGKDLTADAFTFQLVNQDNENEVYTAKNAADGAIVFQDLLFTEPGVYTYLMSEVKGDAAKTFYDDTVYTVTITVTDDLQGNLKATVDFGGKTPVFTNVYTPDPVEVPLTAKKDLTGRDQVAGEFTFEIRDAEGNLISTGTNKADGTIVFEKIQAYGEGEVVLYVTEVAGNAERMEYDDYTYRIKVAVTNENGVLKATVTYLDGDIVFYNEYLPEIPLTGDDTPVGLYAGLLLTSLVAMAAVLVLYRKKETV